MQRVLLIEPDRILAKVYFSQFVLAGFDVVVVADGQAAVHEIDAEKPSVIVMEPQLAAHSGVEFLHELRSYEDWADIPVLIYSSVPKEVFKVSDSVWQRLGVVRYFYKPKSTAKQIIGAIRALGEKQ